MSKEATTTRCPQCGKSFAMTVRICPEDGTVLEHESPIAAQVGQVLDGKYRLDAFLSEGGMGAVYRAAHVMLGRTVAVKLIKPDLVTSADIVRRFQREARAATALNHPNIAAVYDLGQTPDGTLYIAMEFVNGATLKAVIESGGPMSAARSIALLRQVAGALSVAHRNGIVHRDLKPHNIMLARTNAGGELAKLVDFGIAKTFDEATELTMTGFVIGTPNYMAPEQAEGRPVDPRSDLYSLGVIMYEMLTGQVPFKDTSAAAILIKQMKETPVRPSMKNPGGAIPPALDAVAMRCLEKDPARRFQTADEFSAALEHAAATVPGGDETLQPTALMPGTPMATPAGTAAWNGPPLTSPPAPPPSAPGEAPTARVQPPPPIRVSADTRPTAAGSPAIVAGATPPPPKDNSIVTLGLVALVAVVVATGGFLYLKERGAGVAPDAAPPIAEAPSAAPATALPNIAPPPAQSSAAADRGAPATAPAGASTPPQPAPAPANAGAVGRAEPSLPNGASETTAPPPAKPLASALPPGSAPRTVAPAPLPPVAPAPRAAAATQPPVSAPAPRSNQEPARQAPTAVIPQDPAVFFHCAGAQEICSALKTAVDDALDKEGLGNVRNPGRADIDIATRVAVLQERVERLFNTIFTVRTYSIEVNATVTRSSETVSMPASTTLSFDPQLGSERANEKAQLLAGDIVERVKAFAKKKRGG